MTFPDSKYDDVGAYFDAYAGHLARAAASVDRAALAAATDLLTDIYERQATLYVCGNGGSALIADGFVSDHAKLIQTGTDLVPRVVHLAGSLSMLTAIGNDIGYEDTFAYPLRTLGRAGDGLVTISSSGDSENIVRAAQWARDNGLTVLSLTGFSGGRSAGIAHVNLHVEADNYGIIEDTHQSLMHALAQFIRQRRMDLPAVQGCRF
ncbi:MAG: SIS domain-containing protein [Hyphomicrobiales bacterium]|nr:SIS domain-containing protein [Hyphomicrobiales bacterium]MCP5370504.1 SIS domain-containing protein [Hyphomicrobiales bacterium]